MKYCDNCGKIPEEGARFCSFCGTRLKKAQAAPDTPAERKGGKAFFLAVMAFVAFLAIIYVGIAAAAASFGQ